MLGGLRIKLRETSYPPVRPSYNSILGFQKRLWPLFAISSVDHHHMHQAILPHFKMSSPRLPRVLDNNNTYYVLHTRYYYVRRAKQ